MRRLIKLTTKNYTPSLLLQSTVTFCDKQRYKKVVRYGARGNSWVREKPWSWDSWEVAVKVWMLVLLFHFWGLWFVISHLYLLDVSSVLVVSVRFCVQFSWMFGLLFCHTLSWTFISTRFCSIHPFAFFILCMFGGHGDVLQITDTPWTVR